MPIFTSHTCHQCCSCDQVFGFIDRPSHIGEIPSIDEQNIFLKRKHFESFKLNIYYYTIMYLPFYFTVFHLKLVFPNIHVFHIVLH